MTKFGNNLSGTAMAALLTVVFSAVTVLGAVGPAYSSSNSGQTVAAGVAKVPGKSANSLA
ncbi:hypothetical protein KK488_18100 [Sphingobium sp. H33]|uniref:Uncharacterized protein n=2 Tax=Sphingobium nicotianae TaxID=2782607 RepID=A0A9X1IT10_9SPHN|nr:hypothetical protein [Sphingobium nicotianae]